MKLIDIDKTRYRKHLNRVILICIVTLAILSLSISQVLIALFPHESGSHFHWNLLGVVVSVLIIAFALKRFKTHDYMYEVVYVWELKKVLNKINRKIDKLEHAANHGNASAMLALHYSYAGSRFLWQLDDNTLVMDELVVKQAQLDSLAQQHKVSLDIDDYDDSFLESM